ncbi:MAG: sugar ABC transporter permease [Hungatella sp.]|nr:sugar ABC transporter permease [Hungatella sp.]
MKKRKSLFQHVEPYLYLLPAFAFLLVFVYYPFIKNAWLSFHTVNQFRLVKSFAGLKNYAKVLGDEAFIQSIGNTFIYVLVTVPASLLIAYLLAMMARKTRKLSVAYEVLFAISMAASDAVIAMIFQLAYNSQLGIINKVLGTNIDWLHDSRYALMSLMFIQIWKNIGYNFLFMLSALRNLSDDVLEAARLDGVTGWKLHLKVIIPLVSPMLFFLLIKDIAYGMTVSSYTLILTGGGPNNATQTIITYIYSKAITSTNYNYAFAATMVGFFISAVLIMFSMILEKRKVHYN